MLIPVRTAIASFLLCQFTAGVTPHAVRAQFDDGMATETTVPVDEWLFMGDAFEGTFIELADENREWTVQRWRDEFDVLKSIGFETIVIHWTQYDGFGFVHEGNNGRRTLERMAAAADSSRMELYVGLSIRSGWWKIESIDFKFLLDELSLVSQTFDDLYPVFKDHASFKGWYVPHEITELHYSEEQWDLVLEFYHSLTKYIRKIDPMRPVAAAGFTDVDDARVARFGFRLAQFLGRAGVDIFIFQDGAGRSKYRDWRKIIPLYEALEAVDRQYEGDIWLLAEVFTQTAGQPIDDEPFDAVPADIDRVMSQMEAMLPYRKKMIVYDYFNYMRPSKGEAEAALFEAYRERLFRLLAEKRDDWSKKPSERPPY